MPTRYRLAMNNEREDVSMIDGELPIQPTHPLNGLAPMQDVAEENKQRNNAATANGRASRKEEGPVETPVELKATHEYIKRLGEGTYGVVYMARELATNEIVAVKEIKIDHCDDGIPSTAIREIAVLQELRNNPWIVNLKEIVHGLSRNRLFLIFEYFN